ncbi:sterol desaturase family protein [Tenacibaculum caenipelagi]|uniref:Sterol desaturase/sphingolipid hydroxylase (Fatty acid hydroxylase superfamily) n=1 Tax=Tenacibaculum caenipelagi TaxID=1325435 RepID=A0A4R6TKR3_9FLAO|nr:sterol desaturase family protein [Tenacibaculum caenipelagi]TDQ29984.1 sterol desaturase/sphingolipid hydroxylase (fatty acid hydroxylase superfamily) [Tenacibaculum caenipelagi]
MKYKTASYVAVPVLLTFTGTLGYLTIKNDWSFEIASYTIFLFTLIYILILERIIPLKQKWKPHKLTIWTDIKHFIFSTALFDALGKTLALSLIVYIQKHFFTSSNYWDTLPFVVTYIIANLIGEFLPYVYHRVSHKGNSNSYISLLLWKIHSIHHLPTSLNWFKTNWIHPINMLLNTLLKMTPILFLGFSEEIIFLVGITHVMIAYISHANIQTNKSFLDYLIVTPQIHHFHHSKKMQEAKNFGNIFPFWDLLFGTYYNRKGSVDKVGVIINPGVNYPKDKEYLKQLVFPITTTKDCCT